MTVFEALYLMFQAGIFLMSLLYISARKTTKNNQPIPARPADYFFYEKLGEPTAFKAVCTRGGC